jgi:DNA helicase-2/ATP-dependent DNA helicase PcrA
MPLSTLNHNQRVSATTDFGYNLVIASAGTGKTSTIVGRIAHLIKNKEVLPEEILLLTFTNKASGEMISRVAKLLSNNIASRIVAGTFHSISYKYLKQVDPNMLLKSETDIKTLFRSIYEKRDFFARNKDFSVKPYESKHLYELYSFYQNVELTKSFGDWIATERESHTTLADIYEDIVSEFETEKKKLGFLNFNDLLIKMRDNLTHKPVYYREILVDEYQDTNLLQDSLIRALKPKSLFCVGDYDQSIYAFNGANISIIANFTKNFDNAKVHTLTQNYRSTAPILELANRVIALNERLYNKKLEVTKTHPNIYPKLLIYSDLYEQYEKIAETIKHSNTKYENIAILFRNNISADGIEGELRKLGIPSKRRGGLSFFDSREIKAILDIYTILINPRDMMAFIHIFEYFRGLGTAISRELFEGLNKLGNNSIYRGLLTPDKNIYNPFLNSAGRNSYQLLLFDYLEELRPPSRFEHLKQIDKEFLQNKILSHSKLSDDGAEMLFHFKELVKNFKYMSEPKNLIDKIKDSEIFQYIKKVLVISRSKMANGEINEAKKRDVEKSISEKIELLKHLSSAYRDHRAFLNAMVLGSKDLTKGEGVNLLTVHGSKGLEFKDVYIVDLMDGRFPNNRLSNQHDGGIDEERRLFYVAVTRAEERLYLSFSWEDQSDLKKDGRPRKFEPSQFLIEGGFSHIIEKSKLHLAKLTFNK